MAALERIGALKKSADKIHRICIHCILQCRNSLLQPWTTINPRCDHGQGPGLPVVPSSFHPRLESFGLRLSSTKVVTGTHLPNPPEWTTQAPAMLNSWQMDWSAGSVMHPPIIRQWLKCGNPCLVVVDATWGRVTRGNLTDRQKWLAGNIPTTPTSMFVLGMLKPGGLVGNSTRSAYRWHC